MRKLLRICSLFLLIAISVVVSVSPVQKVSAAGTWVSRSPSAALGIAIRDDGVKYVVARGTALWTPMNWGSFVTTNSTPYVFSQSWSVVSVATNSTGTHCVAGESGASITIRYSSNSCESWSQATLVSGTTGSVNAVATSANGQRIFATTSTGAFFASTTASPSFSQRSQTGSWTDVASDSTGSVVIATTSDGQILKSTDFGDNFTQVLTVGAVSINSVALSSDGVIAFAGDANGVLRKSVDSGANWAAMTIPNAGGVRIADIATSADGSKILVALDGGKLLRSTNGGSTWVDEDGVRNWKSVAMSSSGKHMGAGTSTNFYTSSLSLDISSSIPADGAVGVLNDANIVLNFNNKLVLGTGKNFYIRRTSDNSIFETIPVGDARVDYYSTVGRITINPQGTLALATSYYVDTDSGTVTDDHGNEWDSTNQQVRFTTSSTDNVAPTIVSKYPTSTSDRVTTTANISITFNENVRAVAGKFLRVCFPSGTTCSESSERIAVTDSSRVTVTGATVVINPEMELGVNATYFVRVEAGAFEDFSGNDFAGIDIDRNDSSLTAIGVYTLAVDGTAPAFRRACMSADRTTLHLLYDEQLIAGTLINSEFAVTVSGSTQSIQSVVIPNHAAHVTIRLVGAMASGSMPLISYSRHLTTGGIQDTNYNRAISLGSVDASSTSDCTGPLMTATVPALAATDVLRNANIVLEFDETVQMQYGKQLVIRNMTTSTNIEIFSTNDTNRVTVSGNTLIIDPTLDLPANSQISLNAINSGFVEDISENDFWGAQSTTLFTFTTGSTSDTVAPDATGTPDLVAGSDTGSSSTDNITNDSTPTISVTAGENGGTVTVRAEKAGVFHTCQMVGSTSGSTCVLPSLADGVWLITTVHADAIGNMSSRSAAQSITIDSVDPTVSWTEPSSPTSSMTFSYTLTFSEAVSGIDASDFSSTGTATGCVFTPSAATASPSVSVSVTCTGNGSFVAQLKAGMVSDAAGNTGPASLAAATSVTVAADLVAPTASWTEPTTPSSSRTLSYTLTFSEAVSGIVAGDFSFTGTATGCAATPAAGTANVTVSVSVTCTSDGTVTLRLESGSVLDAASNTGPTSDAVATSITITSPAVPTTTVASATTTTVLSSGTTSTTVASTTTVQPTGTTTVTTAPVAAGATTSVPVTETTVAVGQGSIATVTTVAGNTTTPSTTVVATTGSIGVRAADVTTTTTAPIVTTTTIAKLSVIDVPRTDVGGSSVLIGGKLVEGVITRENNRLTVTAGPMIVRIWAVAADGEKLALDADGRLRVKAGDSVTVEATGFSFNTRTEVRLYSDPVLLGRTDVDDKGVMNASYEIPEGIPSGNHNVVLAGERDGSPVTMALSVALGEESSGNALAVVFIGVLIAAGVTALMLPAFLRRRRKEESGE